ncbi:MAG: hypothetical protein C0423_13155 [Methylibium sp.]|nr:hypothetical protein [Methylibium sp.]
MKPALPPSARHWLGLLLALACAGLGLYMAAHHPWQPGMVSLLFLLGVVLGFAGWRVWPLLLPALVPLLGFAPWTGWISFEETDLLLLSAAAGGYAGWALQARALKGAKVSAWQRPLRWSGLSKLLLLAFVASLLLASWRGIADAGGWDFGWYHGYHEPMNSVRSAKAFLLALLLLPLWRAATALQPESLQRWFSLAMAGVLLGSAGVALQERLAFTGLVNFSDDYRTTGPFWEMHVGGAMLDGALALSFPFAFALLWRERRPAAFAALLGLLLLGAYAALTMFSRGVYLALPLGLGLTLALTVLQQRRRTAAAVTRDEPGNWLPGGVLLVVLGAYAAAAVLLFPVGGWRALLALLGNALLLLATPALRLPYAQTRLQKALVLVLAALAAVLATALALVVAPWLPKGEYLVYAVSFAGTAVLVWLLRQGLTRQLHACILAAAWFWNLFSVAIAASGWGGPLAAQAAAVPVLLLALAWTALQLAPPALAQALPGLSWRAKSLNFALLLLVGGVVGALGGGSYIVDRASNSERDMQTRLTHWQLSMDLLTTPADWLFGKGAGRYPSTYFFGGERAQQVGDYRQRSEGSEQFLTLTGGKHMLGWGELFRVTQRIDAPQGEVRLQLRARAAQDLALHFDLCEKHLLYAGACIGQEIAVKAKPGEWQSFSVSLGAAPPMGGSWWAPRWIGFSMAMANRGLSVDLDDIRLVDARGERLGNGDFSQGMAQWFFSSDKHHMPWHAKSLAVHLLFEQGLVGLALASTMVLAALWRCSFGRARSHALAPALAGSLLGFLVVGLFDSLIDAPRIGLLFWLVVLLGLGLRSPLRSAAAGTATHG